MQLILSISTKFLRDIFRYIAAWKLDTKRAQFLKMYVHAIRIGSTGDSDDVACQGQGQSGRARGLRAFTTLEEILPIW